MCRKILMHVAVDKAEAEGNRNFAYYVDQLEAKGFITTGLKPKIDEIRLRGNEATHELPASTDQIADRTLGVTRHLLVSVYELPNS